MNAREVAALSPEAREAFHRTAEARIATHHYSKPANDGRPKGIVTVARSENLKVHVQIVTEGGENNLHYHLNSDTTWMVLHGRVRFYGVGDVLLAELGPQESIFLPGGSRYWFEKSGPEDLEILQMVGIDKHGGSPDRINVERHKDWMVDADLQLYEPTV